MNASNARSMNIQLDIRKAQQAFKGGRGSQKRGAIYLEYPGGASAS
jgi:hypothetical protein